MQREKTMDVDGKTYRLVTDTLTTTKYTTLYVESIVLENEQSEKCVI
jgi:hypothetical protein